MDFTSLAENLGLETDEFGELVDLFVETGSPQVEELREALKTGDGEHIRRLAHSLKGASGNLGLMDISREARTIETLSDAGNFEAVGEAIEKIDTLMEKLRAMQY